MWNWIWNKERKENSKLEKKIDFKSWVKPKKITDCMNLSYTCKALWKVHKEEYVKPKH